MDYAPGANQRLRPLLPQQIPPIQSTPGVERHGKKTRRTRIACDACRLNKSKCSGERPVCKECTKRHTKCHYERAPTETALQGLKRKVSELKSRKSPYEQLFDLLKTASEQDAHDVLDRLRAGVDVETLINHVAHGDLLLQLSVVPETRYRYDFPYISTMPDSLVTDDNPYLQSCIHEATTLFSSPEQSEAPRHGLPSSEATSAPHSHGIGRAMYGPIYLKPFHAAVVVEPLLSEVRISPWTSVCKDDELMRNLLIVWLHCEYHFTSALQKDLFLEDMTAQREDFCSSLLVNIVLAYACVCYPRFKNRAHYWDPQTMTYRFLAEAKRLWELEADQPRITTIQAGLLFNVFYNLSGLDEVGQAYRLQAIALAQSMHLFRSGSFCDQSPRIRNGLAYTAWALFNWETLVGFSFMFAPKLSEPPDWSLPDPSKTPQWYGEVRVRYPMSNELLPLHFGQVFKAKSTFRIIMNEVCQAAYSHESGISFEQAKEFLSRLEAWFNSLPASLTPKLIVLPGHLQLHMYYHHLILTIFKPLLSPSTNHLTPSPQHIVDRASKHLQTLLRLYYVRHGYEAMDLFIVIPLVLAAYDCLDAITADTPPEQLEALRSTLILAAKGLHAQRRNHFLADALFRVVRGRMRPAEVSLLKGIVTLRAEEEVDARPDVARTVRSHWPVTVVRDKREVGEYVLDRLVESYAHLNVDEAGEGAGAGASA